MPYSYPKVIYLSALCILGLVLNTSCGATGAFRNMTASESQKASSDKQGVVIHTEDPATAEPVNGKNENANAEELDEDQPAVAPTVISGAYLSCQWSEQAELACQLHDEQGEAIADDQAYQSKWTLMMADGSAMMEQTQKIKDITRVKIPVDRNRSNQIAAIKVEIMHGDKVLKEITLPMEKVKGDMPAAAQEQRPEPGQSNEISTQGLSLTSTCQNGEDDEGAIKVWQINNPYNYPIMLSWQMIESGKTGTFAAPSGDSTINDVWDDDEDAISPTARITWTEGEDMTTVEVDTACEPVEEED